MKLKALLALAAMVPTIVAHLPLRQERWRVSGACFGVPEWSIATGAGPA